MEEKNEMDKEIELKLDQTGPSIKLKNLNNRVFAKFGDCVIDALSYFRWNNAVKFYDKYIEKKQQRKIEGKETPIPPKFLIEILENAFNEDNEEIQDEWNNLLLNWQDPEKNCDKKYMYIDLLKNLDINEIRLLKLLGKNANYNTLLLDPNQYYDGNKIKGIMGLNDKEYEVMMLNLFRLKICDGVKASGNAIMIGDLPVIADGGIYKFKITILGDNLIRSCEE